MTSTATSGTIDQRLLGPSASTRGLSPADAFKVRVNETVSASLTFAATAPAKVRSAILRELFSSVRLPLEETVQAVVSDHLPAGTIFYYQILSSYYETHREDAERVMALTPSLVGDTYFVSLYALLFYRLIPCMSNLRRSDRFKRYNLLLRGLQRVFRRDVAQGLTNFKPIYRHVLLHLEHATMEQTIPLPPERTIPTIIGLVGSLFFYYDTHDPETEIVRIVSILIALGTAPSRGAAPAPTAASSSAAEDKSNNNSNNNNSSPMINSGGEDTVSMLSASRTQPYFPINSSEGGAAACTRDGVLDIFVRASTAQLRALISEDGIRHYLSNMRAYKALLREYPEMQDTTVNRLQSTLSQFQRVGGPLYLPRRVRHCATDVTDTLFPQGRYSRRLVRLLFRLAHPYYSAQSVIHWAYTQVHYWCWEWPTSLVQRIIPTRHARIKRE